MFDFMHSPALKLAVSAGGGWLGYVIWYRCHIGPWCPAMWGGTAPPVIMLVIAGMIWRIASRVWPSDWIE